MSLWLGIFWIRVCPHLHPSQPINFSSFFLFFSFLYFFFFELQYIYIYIYLYVCIKGQRFNLFIFVSFGLIIFCFDSSAAVLCARHFVFDFTLHWWLTKRYSITIHYAPCPYSITHIRIWNITKKKKQEGFSSDLCCLAYSLFYFLW